MSVHVVTTLAEHGDGMIETIATNDYARGMSEFDDLLRNERDRLSRRRSSEVRAGDDLRERWQVVIPQIKSWLQASARELESRDVQPVPVLGKGGLVRKTYSLTGHRWALGLLSLDKYGNFYSDGFPKVLSDATAISLNARRQGVRAGSKVFFDSECLVLNADDDSEYEKILRSRLSLIGDHVHISDGWGDGSNPRLDRHLAESVAKLTG